MSIKADVDSDYNILRKLNDIENNISEGIASEHPELGEIGILLQQTEDVISAARRALDLRRVAIRTNLKNLYILEDYLQLPRRPIV